MANWTHFSLLLLTQLIVLIAMAVFWHVAPKRVFAVTIQSMIIGAPLGLAFDLLIGRYETIFSYHIEVGRFFFYLLNGLLSYGLALATIWLLPVRLPRQSNRTSGIAAAMSVCLSLLVLIALPSRELTTLVVMLVGGMAILGCSEVIARVCGFQGTISAFLDGEPKQLFQLWFTSIALGTAYEITNVLFPVWIWEPMQGLSFVESELLIIVFGYFVLVYPMFVVTHLVQSAPDRQ